MKVTRTQLLLQNSLTAASGTERDNFDAIEGRIKREMDREVDIVSEREREMDIVRERARGGHT